MTTIIATRTPELFHRRAFLELPGYEHLSAPAVFDQTPRSSGIETSSSRFDRLFGGKHESRPQHPAAPLYHLGPASDTEIQGCFSVQEDYLVGLHQFLYVVSFCASIDGVAFLPRYKPDETCRLLAYIKAVTGAISVAEATRSEHGFRLDGYNLNEQWEATGAKVWPHHTYLLAQNEVPTLP